MGKRSKSRNGRRKAPKIQPGPSLHAKVVAAGGDLSAAMQLVKPGLLYADRVTILSPTAWMLNDVTKLADVDDPVQQVEIMLSIMEQVPELAGQVEIPPQLRESLPVLVKHRLQLQAFARVAGAEPEVAALYASLEQIADGWKAFRPALEQVHDRLGTAELSHAIDRKLVTVEDLGAVGRTDALASSLNAATGGPVDDLFGQVLSGFVASALEALADPKALPMLDAEASGLIRAFDAELGLGTAHDGGARSREIGAVVTLAGFLPYFTEMPVDEIVDLRRELSAPLVRFRAAMARMSRDVASRPLDDDFYAEIAQRWRSDIEPALQEIRETLAEHGFLRQVASIAAGDPRRLMAESGAVIAAALSPQHVFQGAVAAGVAVAAPAVDVGFRAVRERQRGRNFAGRNEFYFLHRVAEEAVARHNRR